MRDCLILLLIFDGVCILKAGYIFLGYIFFTVVIYCLCECTFTVMATHPDLNTDLTYSLPDSAPRQRHKLPRRVSLETQVELLQAEVSVLQQCLNDSLQLQQSILRRFGPPDVDTPAAPHAQLPPMASSTPHAMFPLQGKCHYKV